MAWENIEIQRLERLAKTLRESADRIETLVDDAKAAGLTIVALHFREAERGMDSIRSFVSNADEHIPDQIECKAIGIRPKWERNQARSALVQAKRNAKSERHAKGVEPPKKKVPRKK